MQTDARVMARHAFWGIAALALAACGGGATTSGAPASVTQTVGPEGGTIVVDGATVTFPPSALAAPTAITITKTDEAPPAGFTALSPVYRCAPAGTTFGAKVTMAMTFHGDPRVATIFWTQRTESEFADVGGQVDGDVVRAEVGHFSGGFVGVKR